MPLSLLTPSVILTGAAFVLAFMAMSTVLVKLMPYRKNLIDGSTGLTRFRDYISQSWIKSLRPQNYEEPGHRYIRWLRWTMLLAMACLIALWAALAAAISRG